MRPRVKSYGESSTATLSPAKIRMKFFLIFPETCASTWCLFSSSTRNMAFGNGSITVAITSMASSLGFPESPFFFSSNGCLTIGSQNRPKDRLNRLYLPRRPGHAFGPRENPRTVGGDREGVFEMRRRTSIGGFGHPFAAHLDFRPAGVHHRFDGDNHAFLQTRASSRLPVVWKVGFIVHLRADAVPHKLPHHRVTVLLDPALHRVTNVAKTIARAHFVDRAVQRLAGDIQELPQLRADLPDRHGDSRIGVIAVDLHAEVDRNYVAFAQLPLRRGNPVHDLAIHRRAQHTGIPAITLKRRLPGFPGDEPLGNLLKVHRREPGLHFGPKPVQDFMNHLTRAVHLFQL